MMISDDDFDIAQNLLGPFCSSIHRRIETEIEYLDKPWLWTIIRSLIKRIGVLVSPTKILTYYSNRHNTQIEDFDQRAWEIIVIAIASIHEKLLIMDDIESCYCEHTSTIDQNLPIIAAKYYCCVFSRYKAYEMFNTKSYSWFFSNYRYREPYIVILSLIREEIKSLKLQDVRNKCLYDIPSPTICKMSDIALWDKIKKMVRPGMNVSDVYIDWTLMKYPSYHEANQYMKILNNLSVNNLRSSKELYQRWYR